MQVSDSVFMALFLCLPIGFVSMVSGYGALIRHLWPREDRKVMIKTLLTKNDMSVWQYGPRFAPYLVMIGAACGTVGFGGLLVCATLGAC
jgi:hypothetical protein